jgi:hypothetical protein
MRQEYKYHKNNKVDLGNSCDVFDDGNHLWKGGKKKVVSKLVKFTSTHN